MSVLKYKTSTGKWLPVIGGSGGANPLPYDVVTNSIGGGGGYAKLTIADDWTDAVQHPYRLIVAAYKDDMVYSAWESTFYSPRSDGYCYVEGSMSAVAPQYVVGNDVYITMVNTSDYKVYVKRLDGICTGATLEWVDSLPDVAPEVFQGNRSVDQSYISYTANGVTSPRPVAFYSRPYSIVCRDSNGDIITTVYKSDDAAVSKKYVRDTLLAPVVVSVEAVVSRVDSLENLLVSYVEDGATAYSKEVPVNSAPNAILESVGGATYRRRSCVNISPEVIRNDFDERGIPTWEVDKDVIVFSGSGGVMSIVIKLGEFFTPGSGTMKCRVESSMWYTATEDIDPLVRYDLYAVDPYDVRYPLNDGTTELPSDGGTWSLIVVGVDDYGTSSGATFKINVEPVDSDDMMDSYWRLYGIPVDYFEDAAVSSVVSKTSGTVLDEYTVPSEITSLNGYGMDSSFRAVGNVPMPNILNFSEKTFSRYTSKKVLTADDISLGEIVTLETAGMGIETLREVLISKASDDYLYDSTYYMPETYMAINGFPISYSENFGYGGTVCNDKPMYYVYYAPENITLENAQQLLEGRVLYYVLKNSETIDVSEYLTDYEENKLIKVSPSGTLTFENAPQEPVPSTVCYILK